MILIFFSYFVSSTFGQLLIFAITAIFIASLYFVIQGIIRYRMVEMEELQQVKDNLKKLDQQQGANFNADHLYNKLIWNCSDSIASQRLKNIYNIVLKKQKLDYDSLVEADYLQENALFSNHFIKYARTAMLLIGLFGTFYGLSQMVGGIGTSYSALDTGGNISKLLESYKQATQSMRGMVSPMESAFSTTFWGLLGTVLLAAAMLPYNWIRKRLFADLDQMTSTRLIPLFNPSDKGQELVGLIEKVGFNTQIMNEVVTKLDQVSSGLSVDFENVNQFSRNLQTSIEIYVKGQELLHKDIVALSNMIQKTHDSSSESGASTYKILEALNIHNVSIDKLNKKLDSTEFNVSDWLKEIINLSREQQAKFQEDIKSILSLTRSNLSNTQSATNRFGISIRKFETSLETLQTYLSNFNSVMEGSAQAQVEKLHQIASAMQNLTQLLSKVNYSGPPVQQVIRPVQTQPVTPAKPYMDPNQVEKMANEMANAKLQEKWQTYSSEYEALKLELERLRARQSEENSLRQALNSLLSKPPNNDNPPPPNPPIQ